MADEKKSYGLNSETERRALMKTMEGALDAGKPHGVLAVAVVISLENGHVTAAFGGEGSKKSVEALANLLRMGPDVMKACVRDALKGGGSTILIDQKTGEIISKKRGL